MHNTVVIKGNKSGLTVYLDPDIPFSELLEDIGKKFRESSKFWGSVQMVLTLEGRKMTTDEECQIVNTITDNSHIDILCLVDTNIERIAKCEKALNEKLMELSSCTGQFYKGSLRRGETLESESSIVIIGDVCHGSRVIAKGNVIVLGELRGTVHAGAAGNQAAVIVALEMAPLQLRIADNAKALEGREKKLGRGPMIAALKDGKISVKQLKKSFFSILNSI